MGSRAAGLQGVLMTQMCGCGEMAAWGRKSLAPGGSSPWRGELGREDLEREGESERKQRKREIWES